MSDSGQPPKRQTPSKQQTDALTALFQQGRHSDAVRMAQTLCAEFPRSMAVWNIRGASARSLGQLDEAEQSFRTCCELNARFAGAPYNLGLVLDDRGQSVDAIAAYRRALEIDPGLAEAHNNLGVALTRSGELDSAIAHLKCARASKPELPETHNSLGNALKQAERFTEAAASYRQALSVKPDFAKALYNLGVIEQERGDANEAVAMFRKTLAMEPDNALAQLHLIYQLMQHCDWPGLAEFEGGTAGLGVTGDSVPPWPLLALEDAPLRQLARSRNWAKRRFRQVNRTTPARPKRRPERLRIGYFSGDFHDHPSMHLMAGLLAGHDRARFEIHAFSYGEQREDAYRQKARDRVHHFHDVARWPDAKIIDLARRTALDIAIDRKGYSAGTRNQLLQHRLAPVQMNYLAYPGTLGASFIDYLIGDPVVTPAHTRDAFSESIIQLPHNYQPNDNQRTIAETQTTRADFGLPQDAFVFCCFNATYKISPHEFDIWMRVLKAVGGSVLWLFQSNAHAVANLRREAEQRGVDPLRLVFAERVPSPEHLARHKHADLFIDTFNVNAHTTASDALWAGLPVVTKQGEQFAARVASSLLRAVGLPELVTKSDADYERLIVELATNPELLTGIRAKLSANRLTTPLFDTKAYTRHFEAGLEAAYDRYFKGLPPADIVVQA